MANARRKRWFAAGTPASPDVLAAGEAFRASLAAVEGAKAALVTVVRSGRAPGAPLAEALAGFEVGLASAAEGMAAWRVPEVADIWPACAHGLAEAREHAAALRLNERPPEIYEHLIAALEDLMDPLEPFERAASAFRAIGVRV